MFFFLFLFGSLWTAAAATIGSAGRYDVWSTFGPQHTLYCTWGSVDESSGCHHRWLLPPNIHARGSVDGGWVVVVDADQYARGEGKNGRIQRRAKLRDGAAVSHSCWRRIGCRRGFLSPCLFLYIYIRPCSFFISFLDGTRPYSCNRIDPVVIQPRHPFFAEQPATTTMLGKSKKSRALNAMIYWFPISRSEEDYSARLPRRIFKEPSWRLTGNQRSPQ